MQNLMSEQFSMHNSVLQNVNCTQVLRQYIGQKAATILLHNTDHFVMLIITILQNAWNLFIQLAAIWHLLICPISCFHN